MKRASVTWSMLGIVAAVAMLAAVPRVAGRTVALDEKSFRAAVRPALQRALRDRPAGCAAAACHGSAASPRLFDPALPTAPGLDARSLERALDRLRPTQSALLHRMLGERGHPASLRSTSDAAYLEIAA